MLIYLGGGCTLYITCWGSGGGTAGWYGTRFRTGNRFLTDRQLIGGQRHTLHLMYHYNRMHELLEIERKEPVSQVCSTRIISVRSAPE